MEVTLCSKIECNNQDLHHISTLGTPNKKEVGSSEPSSGIYSDPLTWTLKQATERAQGIKTIQPRRAMVMLCDVYEKYKKPLTEKIVIGNLVTLENKKKKKKEKN